MNTNFNIRYTVKPLEYLFLNLHPNFTLVLCILWHFYILWCEIIYSLFSEYICHILFIYCIVLYVETGIIIYVYMSF